MLVIGWLPDTARYPIENTCMSTLILLLGCASREYGLLSSLCDDAIPLHGCAFHFQQALWRKIEKLGLQVGVRYNGIIDQIV